MYGPFYPSIFFTRKCLLNLLIVFLFYLPFASHLFSPVARLAILLQALDRLAGHRRHLDRPAGWPLPPGRPLSLCLQSMQLKLQARSLYSQETQSCIQAMQSNTNEISKSD